MIRSSVSVTSDLLLCGSLLDPFRLQDLLRPSPLQRLQTDSIHLIQEHRQQTRLYAVRCLTVCPRANHSVDLVEEQDAGSAGPGLTKQLTRTDASVKTVRRT